MTVNSRSFVIKNGTESGHRLDNYIFHIVQIANDCCCGNLITLHLMKRQLMPHDRVTYTHRHTRVRAFQAILFVIYDIILLEVFLFSNQYQYHLHLLEYLSTV